MKKLLSFTLILILITVLLHSCKKDKGEPPVLPPQESMTIDFSNFAIFKKSATLIVGQKGTENSNWEFASNVAGIWNLIITGTLAVPVAVFKLAVSQTPVYLSQKNWQWSYTTSVAGVAYKARLTGAIGASDVKWKMYITKEGAGGFTEFLWFEGTSKSDGTGGQWMFYESPQTPVVLLQIDWTASGASIATIKYTLVKNDAYYNSYIQYGLTSATLNGYYTINYFNGLKFSDVNIEWNTTTHDGRVKSPEYLLGDWYCWDSNKINSICP
jgi:hypothetical protein